MKKLLTLTISTFIASLAVSSACANDANTATFTEQQQQEIGKIASQYIVNHPEVLIAASQKLQQQQQAAMQVQSLQAAIDNADQLRDDPMSPVLGNPKGKVTIVEFIDANCHYCHKVQPVLDSLLQHDTDVRYVVKQNAIFAEHWLSSQRAAQASLMAYQQGGSAMYAKFNTALFKLNKEEGKLTVDDVEQIEKTVGVEGLDKIPEKINAQIEKDKALATSLGMQGTPGFVVLPSTGIPTKETTSVLLGYVDEATLQDAVKKAAT